MPRSLKNGEVGWFIDPGTVQEIEKSLPDLKSVLGLPEPPPVSFVILLFLAVGAVFVSKAAKGFNRVEFSNPDNDEIGILSLDEMIRTAYDRIVIGPDLEKMVKL